jgi:Inositol hexakisphosphate
MREEPVIYINGRPYVVREAVRPFANLEYTGDGPEPGVKFMLRRIAWVCPEVQSGQVLSMLPGFLRMCVRGNKKMLSWKMQRQKALMVCQQSSTAMLYVLFMPFIF